MSFHREAMAQGREALQANAGRLVTYVPPKTVGAARTEGVVRHRSGEDAWYESTDRGGQRRREVVVNAPIGTGEGQFPAVHVGGAFLLEIDGTGVPEPWTIESFKNADAGADDGMGYTRCLCVRELRQNGIIGAVPENR